MPDEADNPPAGPDEGAPPEASAAAEVAAPEETSAVDEPASAEAQATEEAPVAEEAPAPEEVAAPEAAPAPEEAPAAEETPATEEAPTAEEAPAPEEAPAAEEAPAPEDAPPAAEEAPVPEDAPPAAEEAPAPEEAQPAPEEALAPEGPPAAQEVTPQPAEEEAPAEDNAPERIPLPPQQVQPPAEAAIEEFGGFAAGAIPEGDEDAGTDDAYAGDGRGNDYGEGDEYEGPYEDEGPYGDEYGEEYEDEEDDEDDSDIFGSDGAMNPDNPLLARAQQALKEQLLDAKLRLTEELREKKKGNKDAKAERENIGVELYGVQQQLAKLQLQLERTHENYNMINRIRLQAEEELDMMRHAHEEHEAETQDEQFRVQKFQDELDNLAGTLKQIEAYNEQMKDEIAVTRRQTYVAEESVQRREKAKKDQDYLIDNLQETLKNLHQQLALYSSQLEAQKRETLAAKETLQEAEEEMENIHFEKKQLVQQWQGTLIAVQRRDEALQAVQDAIYEQQQQELNIDNETEGFRRDIVKEQLKNEQLTAVLRKVEGESEFLMKNIATLREKQERLQDTYAKLQKSSEQTEEQLSRTDLEKKVLESEKDSVDKAIHKTANEIKELENQMLAKLSEQTTAEKAAQKTAKDTVALRKKVREEEINLATLQNEMAKLEVDCLNTDAHNDKLKETLKLLDEEIKDKLKTIEQYELEIRRRNDEIEKRTKEVDILNRKYEKLTANMEDENTGPLEATINNLQREITQKGVEGKELQRHWLSFQSELVQLVADNNKLAETVSRLKSEYNIIGQKCHRLDQKYEAQMKEVRDLDTSMSRMHHDLSRLNAHIAKNSELQELLANDNFNLENRIMAELKEMEEDSVRLEQTIEQEKVRKKDTLADMMEVERQIMLWERKIQLQREMLEALDPTVGDDVIGAMKKEIHRMELRYSELMRLQEKLVAEMERGISKRSVIGMKGKATQTKKTTEMTEQQLAKACADLKRSIRETDKESYVAEQRIGELEAVHRDMMEQIEQTLTSTQELDARQEELKIGLETALSEKHKMLLYTSHQQAMCKRLEDALDGKYRRVVADNVQVEVELNAALEKHETIIDAVEQLRAQAPELSVHLDKILLHSMTRSM